MIPEDWANMSQGVWRSPLLPALTDNRRVFENQIPGAMGSGVRFKRDLLAYLNAYGRKKTDSLVRQLRGFDFSSIRAALIASIPSRQMVDELDIDKQSLWGWPALKETLKRVPVKQDSGLEKREPHIVIQVPFILSFSF